MSRSRGLAKASVTALCVISWKATRLRAARRSLTSSAMCQAIASPSRSGSVASHTASASLAALRIAVTAFFSRLLPVVRTFTSLPAGVAKMPFGKFTLYTFLGVIPWTYALTWAGVAVGANWERVAHLFDLPTYLIGGGRPLAAAAWYRRKRKRRRS